MMNSSQALALAAIALCIMVLILPVTGAEGAGNPGSGPGGGNAPPSGPGTTRQPGTGTQADPGAAQGQQNRVPSNNPVSPPAQPGNITPAATAVPTTLPVTPTMTQATPVQRNNPVTAINAKPVATTAATVQPPPADTGGSLLPILIALVAIGILAAGSYAIYRRRKGTRNEPPAPAPSSAQTTIVARSSLPPEDVQRPGSFPTLPAELSERYTSTEFIGKGGFAAVFKATKRDGTIVAVKVPLAMNSSTGKTFIAEIQNWTKLSHQNIVRVYDYNIMPVPYLELEYCDSSLACLARPLTSIEAEMLIFGVCEGLKFTHAHGLIHRDLKPENILLKNWVPKISDWGLSKEIDKPTVTTTAIFTPSFAAPEQINRQHKDERTDIWQLGVILYNLMTAEEPFPGESAQDIMTGILMREPRRPKEINPAAEDLDGVITTCLQKDPELRYQSVAELQAALVQCLNHSCDAIFSEWKQSGNLLQYDFFYGEILLINLKCGNVSKACTLASDILNYVTVSRDLGMEEIVLHLHQLMDSGSNGIPYSLIADAETIVSRIKEGIRPRAQESNTTRRM